MTKDRNPICSMFYAIPISSCCATHSKVFHDYKDLSCAKLWHHNKRLHCRRSEPVDNSTTLIKKNDLISHIVNPIKVCYRQYDHSDDSHGSFTMSYFGGWFKTTKEKPLLCSDC